MEGEQAEMCDGRAWLVSMVVVLTLSCSACVASLAVLAVLASQNALCLCAAPSQCDTVHNCTAADVRNIPAVPFGCGCSAPGVTGSLPSKLHCTSSPKHVASNPSVINCCSVVLCLQVAAARSHSTGCGPAVPTAAAAAGGAAPGRAQLAPAAAAATAADAAGAPAAAPAAVVEGPIG